MKNLMKKAVLVTAAAAGMAVLGASGSAFAATMPDAGSVAKGATQAVTQQAKSTDQDAVTDQLPGSLMQQNDKETTNSSQGVTPSVEQSVKRWNRGGAAVGFGAASMVSSAWVGIPQQVITDGQQVLGQPVTQVTDHIHG